jgi:hypothetical protein
MFRRESVGGPQRSSEKAQGAALRSWYAAHMRRKLKPDNAEQFKRFVETA